MWHTFLSRASWENEEAKEREPNGMPKTLMSFERVFKLMLAN
jgi:hypothetical protein